MNGKFDKMNETINSLTQFKRRRADFPFSKDQSNRAESKTGYVNACFHCAKANHRFGDCRSATDADKNAIKDSLKSQQFDYKNLQVRANKIANDKQAKFRSGNLNFNTTTQ